MEYRTRKMIVKKENHRMKDCFKQWKERERTSTANRGVIDLELQSQTEKERQRWRDILTRIIDCIKFLVTQNLALRGHREILQLHTVSNAENFLALLKLLAGYDLLAGVCFHPSWTASTDAIAFLNEFIHMMASSVRQSLLRGIRKAKYYGHLFDTTPDLAHREQMSKVVRYVEVDFQKKTVHVTESFLGFIQISQKDAESLVQNILKRLEDDGMDLQDWRSQCYDNAAVMAGHRSYGPSIGESGGLTRHLRDPLRREAHVRDSTVSKITLTHRLYHTRLTPGSSMSAHLSKMKQMIAALEEKGHQFVEQQKAYIILSSLDASYDNLATSLEALPEKNLTVPYLCARLIEEEKKRQDTLLLRAETTPKFVAAARRRKQNNEPGVLVVKRCYTCGSDQHLQRFCPSQFRSVQGTRETISLKKRKVLVSESLERGFGLCEEWDAEVERRVRCKKTMAGEKCRDAGLTAKQEMERVMRETLDHLHREMDERFTHLHDDDTKFGFLLDTEGLCYSDENVNLKNNCETFTQFYSSDVDGEQLYEEILDCRMLISKWDDVRIPNPEELLQFIVAYGDESVFPNFRIQILLAIAVSIASCERSSAN
ncbi:hypothetical protein lerEdw1_017066 [Lerista edwardsae]|nr:hypothetical protein lerEdw1_017066 [Lerista edwardsae]